MPSENPDEARARRLAENIAAIRGIAKPPRAKRKYIRRTVRPASNRTAVSTPKPRQSRVKQPGDLKPLDFGYLAALLTPGTYEQVAFPVLKMLLAAGYVVVVNPSTDLNVRNLYALSDLGAQAVRDAVL